MSTNLTFNVEWIRKQHYCTWNISCNNLHPPICGGYMKAVLLFKDKTNQQKLILRITPSPLRIKRRPSGFLCQQKPLIYFNSLTNKIFLISLPLYRNASLKENLILKAVIQNWRTKIKRADNLQTLLSQKQDLMIWDIRSIMTKYKDIL